MTLTAHGLHVLLADDAEFDGLLVRLPRWQPQTNQPLKDWTDYLQTLAAFGQFLNFAPQALVYLAIQDGDMEWCAPTLADDRVNGRLRPDYLGRLARRLIGNATGMQWTENETQLRLYHPDYTAEVCWTLRPTQPETPTETDFRFYAHGAVPTALTVDGYTIIDTEPVLHPLEQFAYSNVRPPLPGERQGVSERVLMLLTASRWKRGPLWMCADEPVFSAYLDPKPAFAQLTNENSIDEQFDRFFTADQRVLTVTPWPTDMQEWFPNGRHVGYDNGVWQLI